MKKKIKESVVIYNPVSTGFKKDDLEKIEDVLKMRDLSPIFLESRYKGNVPNLIKQVDDKNLLILTLGGDGTVSEAYQALNEINQRGIYAHLPTGTTNDMALNYNVKSSDIQTNLINILNGEIKYYDSFMVNDKIAAYIGAFGHLAHVPYVTDNKLKKTLGHNGYIAKAITELMKKPVKYDVTIESDNIKYDDDIILGAISNSIGFAGIKIYNDIRFDDGLLEVLLLKNINTKLLISIFNDYLKKDINLNKYKDNIISFKTDELKITFNDNMLQHPVDVDGENSNIITNKQNNSLVFKTAKKIKVLRARN